jgi:DNA repair protein RecO (recombination protein O)
MLEKDEGIILKTSRRGETSLDLVFLGRLGGKIRLIAKGAMNQKSGFRGALEPGHHLDIVYYFKPERTVYYLKEASVRSIPSSGRNSLDSLAVLLAALELLDQVCFAASPDERLVDATLTYLQLPPAADPLFMFLVFELILLDALGALPDFFSCADCGRDTGGGRYDPKSGECLCREHAGAYPAGAEVENLSPELMELMTECFNRPLDSLGTKEVVPALRKDLGKIIHRTYTYHVQGYRLPESLKLLK